MKMSDEFFYSTKMKHRPGNENWLDKFAEKELQKEAVGVSQEQHDSLFNNPISDPSSTGSYDADAPASPQEDLTVEEVQEEPTAEEVTPLKKEIADGLETILQDINANIAPKLFDERGFWAKIFKGNETQDPKVQKLMNSSNQKYSQIFGMLSNLKANITQLRSEIQTTINTLSTYRPAQPKETSVSASSDDLVVTAGPLDWMKNKWEQYQNKKLLQASEQMRMSVSTIIGSLNGLKRRFYYIKKIAQEDPTIAQTILPSITFFNESIKQANALSQGLGMNEKVEPIEGGVEPTTEPETGVEDTSAGGAESAPGEPTGTATENSGNAPGVTTNVSPAAPAGSSAPGSPGSNDEPQEEVKDPDAAKTDVTIDSILSSIDQFILNRAKSIIGNEEETKKMMSNKGMANEINEIKNGVKINIEKIENSIQQYKDFYLAEIDSAPEAPPEESTPKASESTQMRATVKTNDIEEFEL